jgi:hypothetical protein
MPILVQASARFKERVLPRAPYVRTQANFTVKIDLQFSPILAYYRTFDRQEAGTCVCVCGYRGQASPEQERQRRSGWFDESGDGERC